MTPSETKKAAYRWVGQAIDQWLGRVRQLTDLEVVAEVERIRDAMAQAGAIEVAKPEKK
jgi:hypothetical protein